MMAEEMLKQAGFAPIKESSDFLALKKLNNQPLDQSMERSKEDDDYLPFTPLSKSDTPKETSQFSTNGSLSSGDDRFHIRNMTEQDSEETSFDEMETTSTPPPDPSNIHVHEHAYVKTPPIVTTSQDEDVSKEKTNDLTSDETDGELSKDVNTKLDEQPKENGTSSELETLPSAKSEKPDNSAKAETNSQEMQCQTENFSDDDSTDGDDLTEKEEEKSHVLPTPGSDNKTETVNVTSKTGDKAEPMEDDTLTMICESITKETFNNDNVKKSDDEDDDDEDYVDEEDEEYVEYKEAKKKKVKVRPIVQKATEQIDEPNKSEQIDEPNKSEPVLEWKEEYGSTRDLDGDPVLLCKPFEQGWRRELVIRGVYEEYSKSGQPKRKPADVYYFTPEGSKLRSKIQIASYLQEKGSNLTQENFSFIRRPIHKPPMELVRQAGKSKSRRSFASPAVSKTNTSTPSTTPSNKHTHKRKKMTGRPRKLSLPEGLQKTTEIICVPSIIKQELPSPEVVMEREGQEKPYDTNTNTVSFKRKADDPISSFPKKSKPTARKSTTQAAKQNNQPKIMKSAISTKPSIDQLCGLDCPGRGGTTPSLQCGVCMCLFHPECVNYVNSSNHFVCLRCQKPMKVPIAGPVISSATSMVQPTPMLRSCLSGPSMTQPIITTVPSQSLSQLSTMYIPVQAPNVMAVNTMPNGQVAPMTIIRQLAPVPGAPLTLIPTSSPSLTGAIAPPKLTPAPITRTPSDPSADSSMVSKSVLNGAVPTTGLTIPDSKVISVSNATLVSKSNKDPGKPEDENSQAQSKSTPAQLLTLPPAIGRSLDLTQPLALKINNRQIVAPPSCFLKYKNGVKVCLPPNTIPVTSGESSFDMQIKDTDEGAPNTLCVVMNGESKSPQANRIKPKPNYCYFRNVWNGFEVMLEIFSRLHPDDLLRARCVCKIWNRLAIQHELWKHVNMKQLHIKQWNKAVKFLKKVGTESLDFRECLDPPNNSDIFPSLSGLVLDRLDLGEVSISVLHSVADHMSSLTALTAKVKGESESVLNFSKLSQLTNLKVLQLFGSGVKEDMAVKHEGIAELITLTGLETLTLTCISNIDENDWRFLGETTKLRHLQLSDCSTWNSSTYFLLGQCTELESLRLANGGVLPDIGLADALSNLSKLRHLSLENWKIPHSLQDVLSELEHLTSLTIAPHSDEKSAVINRNTLSAVWDLSSIKLLKWAISNSQDSSIILNDSAGDDSEPKSKPSQTTQCIPFLADDVESDDISVTDVQQMTQFISVEQLREKLQSLLPSTKIEVYAL